MTRRSLGRGPILAVAIASVFCGGQLAAAADKPVDPKRQREEIRAKRAEAARQLDLLRASDAEVGQALDDLEANISEQRTEVDAASQAVDAAQRAVQDAANAVAAKQAEVEQTSGALLQLSLAAYVETPVATPIDVLSGDSEATTALRYGLTQLQSRYLDDAVAKLLHDQDGLEDLRSDADAASQAAARRQQEESTQLDKLQLAYQDQQSVADGVQNRIDRALSESDSLAALDKQLSDQIARQEAELAARLKAAKEKAAREQAARDLARAAANAKNSKSSGSSRSGSGTASSSAADSSGASGGSVRVVNDVKVTTVRGITVATSIASKVDQLLGAAAADGLNLFGAGFRDPVGQVALRRDNCGTSDFDIWEKPASDCAPPTARPGRSMHEQGLAIDFTCNGSVVTRSDSCYPWLKANAGKYGLKNLPSEPWHWSTTGG